MTATTLAGRIARFMDVPADNPELLKAQYRAFSRQLPMMYFILISSTWAVAVTYRAITPAWLTVGIPLLLTLACAIRVLHWWPSRRIDPTPELALRALKRTNRLASIMAVSFTAWSLALFHHGDPYTRSYLAFYMAITVIACIFCLMHLRSAAITVTVIVNGAFIAFFASTGQPTFIAIAINMALVSVGLLVILMVNYRDFTAMVNAQTEARRREEEQGRLLHMIDDMPVAVMTVEPGTFAINYVNNTSRRLIDRIAHLLPIDADTLLGTSIDVFHTHPEHQRRLLADPANLPHNARIRLGPEVLDLKVSAVRANDGSYIGPMLTWALVTKEVEAEHRIRQLAHYDTLTGLANRTHFREQLDARLEAPGARLGLLYIDLDGFKLVNDTKGHRAGDALLERVAQRLRAVCDCPGVAIARLGGDEFAVLVPHDDAERAAALAAELIEALGAPAPSAPTRASGSAHRSASRSPPPTAATPRTCSPAPISRSTPPRPPARAWHACSARTWKRASRPARAWRHNCAWPSIARTACSSSTSRSSMSRPARSPRARRWCAGTTRSGAGSRPTSSSRSPNRAASSTSSAASCCTAPAAKRPAGKTARAWRSTYRPCSWARGHWRRRCALHWSTPASPPTASRSR
ncbi:fragment of putative diguanylate cyclase(GGDEF domain) and c-di-GMP phosphodiesterase (EAL domain) (part 1) [Ralstonia solanacearum K60]|nr:fragment of putative diguanylate cyclase(GGDEF domain) and c-di-GMP phosphodiesterase (EAL domain) (part 1) [Ralstonia solanacearum K60]